MTPTVRAIIRAALASGWMRYAKGLAAGSVIIVVLGLMVGATTLDLGPEALAKFLLLLIGSFVAIVALILVIDVAALWRDLRSDTYLRSTGMITADEEWDYRFFYKLQVNGVWLRSPWTREGDAPFSVLNGGSVDHTRHAHLVLAIRDADGRDIYLSDGYGR